MKKLILSAVFAAAILSASSANASAITDQVQAAISAGNYAQINTIVAANPTASGEVGAFLLQQAQSKVGSNPGQAAQIFSSATPFVGSIPADQSANAASIIASFTTTASGSAFQTANPAATSSIFNAALTMSAQPNILSADPALNGTVTAAANEYADAHPDDENLKKTLASLAQAPTTPTTFNLGARAPSAE